MAFKNINHFTGKYDFFGNRKQAYSSEFGVDVLMAEIHIISFDNVPVT